jgi:hypothetical protein
MMLRLTSNFKCKAAEQSGDREESILRTLMLANIAAARPSTSSESHPDSVAGILFLAASFEHAVFDGLAIPLEELFEFFS